MTLLLSSETSAPHTQKPNAQRLGLERRRVKHNLATDRGKRKSGWGMYS
jgi:hypothetical protein